MKPLGTKRFPCTPKKGIVLFGTTERPICNDGRPANQASWCFQRGGLIVLQQMYNVKWMRPGGPKGPIDDLKGSYKEPAVNARGGSLQGGGEGTMFADS